MVCTVPGDASVTGEREAVNHGASVFFVRERFESFEQLQGRIQLYEQQHFVKLYKRDCKTIQAAQRRVNRVMNKHIKYYTVTFCFIHGGKKFKARGEEKRSSS